MCNYLLGRRSRKEILRRSSYPILSHSSMETPVSMFTPFLSVISSCSHGFTLIFLPLYKRVYFHIFLRVKLFQSLFEFTQKYKNIYETR
jgi:hypothetical protein